MPKIHGASELGDSRDPHDINIGESEANIFNSTDTSKLKDPPELLFNMVSGTQDTIVASEKDNIPQMMTNDHAINPH